MGRLPGCGGGAPGAVPTAASRHVATRTVCKADEFIRSPFGARGPARGEFLSVVGSETAKVTARRSFFVDVAFATLRPMRVRMTMRSTQRAADGARGHGNRRDDHP